MGRSNRPRTQAADRRQWSRGLTVTTGPLAVAAQEADPQASLRAKRAMHPIPRGGTLAEMGAIVVYLASDESAFMTGQALAVDGGYTAR